MILTDTLNQPLALAIYATLGIIFGIIYMLNSFICAYLIKSALYTRIANFICDSIWLDIFSDHVLILRL